MADKEERILIIKVEPECIYREIHETTAGGFTTVDLMCAKKKHTLCDEKMFSECKHKKLSGISRAEAVKRMAKAIFQRDNVLSLDIGFDKLEQCTKNFYLELAEASLDALLGGKK